MIIKTTTHNPENTGEVPMRMVQVLRSAVQALSRDVRRFGIFELQDARH